MFPGPVVNDEKSTYTELATAAESNSNIYEIIVVYPKIIGMNTT